MYGLSINYIRTAVCGLSRQQPLISNMIKHVYKVPRRCESLDSTKPFDNMPFNVTNRYFCTVVFAFLFGSGLWAPFLILWYSMAKGSL